MYHFTLLQNTVTQALLLLRHHFISRIKQTFSNIYDTNSEQSRLLESIHKKESLHSSDPVDDPEIKDIASDIFNLYQATYGRSRNLPIILVPPGKVADFFGNDQISENVVRGKYLAEVGVTLSPDKKSVRKVEPADVECVLVALGNPALIYDQNSRGVFRHILGHEYVHSQAEPISLVETSQPILKPSDLQYGGRLHYIQGFKAMSVNTTSLKKTAVSARLDEYMVQYFAMHMHNAFNHPDPVLEAMKVHGLGIARNSILGAETMHQITKLIGLKPEALEEFRYASDIRGFLAEFDRLQKGLSRQILKSGTDPNPETSLTKLRSALKLL